jgi:hypothetical protein
MFQPNPEDHLHLRLHRARSVVLTNAELVEVRAAQRTFEGAYMRTALGQFSFALIILKVFTAEFYPIGALFAVYGAAVMVVATYRRHEGQRQFFNCPASVAAKSKHPGPPVSATPEMTTVTAVGVSDVVAAPASAAAGTAPTGKFRTSGNSVAMLTLLSIGAYITLLVLTWRLSV